MSYSKNQENLMISTEGNLTLPADPVNPNDPATKNYADTKAIVTDLTPYSVGSSNSVGISDEAARADHTHRGISSFRESGGTLLYGDVTISEGSNITLTQSGQNISIARVDVGFRAYESVGGDSIGTAVTNIICNAENFDTHNGYSTSTGAYIIPVAGTYLLGFRVNYQVTMSATQRSYSAITYNGSTIIFGARTFGTGSNDELSSECTGIYKCSAGATIRFIATSEVATSVLGTAQGSTFCYAYRIGV